MGCFHGASRALAGWLTWWIGRRTCRGRRSAWWVRVWLSFLVLVEVECPRWRSNGLTCWTRFGRRTVRLVVCRSGSLVKPCHLRHQCRLELLVRQSHLRHQALPGLPVKLSHLRHQWCRLAPSLRLFHFRHQALLESLVRLSQKRHLMLGILIPRWSGGTPATWWPLGVIGFLLQGVLVRLGLLMKWCLLRCRVLLVIWNLQIDLVTGTLIRLIFLLVLVISIRWTGLRLDRFRRRFRRCRTCFLRLFWNGYSLGIGRRWVGWLDLSSRRRLIGSLLIVRVC